MLVWTVNETSAEENRKLVSFGCNNPLLSSGPSNLGSLWHKSTNRLANLHNAWVLPVQDNPNPNFFVLQNAILDII